ncbi:AAA family ATPase [Winogradskyella algicola]|uniref:AAA family ATPase n=1 Tax=Winogradskyella algicola TaxID=2575815 RepID=UPI0011097F10|nr:AAA family ATPase [Winogradskyella algicola]
MKIQNLTINKYKAFQRSENIAVSGKNVFIYGENGSGKSSVYYALKDFFQSSVENINMANLRNLYLTDGQTDCAIEVEFDGNAKFTLNESTKTTNTASITDCNRLKSFITYKHLLGVHNVKLKDELNVFNLIINGVLKHFKSQTITGGIELGELWKDVLEESKKTVGRGKDFNQHRQKKASVERKALSFNNALNKLFLSGNPDYLAPAVNKVLEKLVPDLKIEFNRHTIQVNQWGGISQSKILLNIESDGTSLDSHYPHFALNEAKLSAIAISIFLAAILRQSRFSEEIKILFLDDILIGLDNEHRLKLIKLLKEPEFEQFQIFITTYDRHWYEVAKVQLTNWKFLEFYKGVNGPEINDKVKTEIQKAELYKNSYDYPAAANSLRKVLEKTLKEKLPETHTLSEEVKGLLKPPKLDTLINRLKEYYKDLEIEIPDSIIDGLKTYKTVLLNPMSHDDIESPIYKNDIEAAFKVIDDLQKIELPKREVVIEKNKVFTITLPAISYTAELVTATYVYKIDNDGDISFSTPEFSFNKWTREGVDFAMDTDSPPLAYTQDAKLNDILRGPYTCEVITNALNRTFTDRSVPNIVETDLKNAMECDGKTLTQWLV